MTFDPARIAQELNAFWDTFAPLVIAVLGLGALVLAIISLRAMIHTWHRQGLHAKKVIGFALVQVGVTYVIIKGVYEFFAGVLAMPPAEAAPLAVYVEAVTWASVGFIYAHGKGTRADGKPNVGFGDAGPLFWIAVLGGAALAVLASPSWEVALGRLVIVVFGAAMWYLQLLGVTTRAGTRPRWRWTPKRLLLAIGALAPEDDDITNEAHEWQVRRLARSIRWSNGKAPLRWLGRWTLVRRAETTTETVLAEARRRYAAAHVVTDHVRPQSPVMAAVIASVQDQELGRVESQRREIAELRARLARLATELETQRAASAGLPAEVDRLTHDLAATRAEADQAQAAAGAARAAEQAAHDLIDAQRTALSDVRHHATSPTPARRNGAAPARTPQRRAVTTPVPAGTPDRAPRSRATTKDAVFELLDQEAAAGRARGTQQLAELVLDRLGGRLDTVKRYVRDWRNARGHRQADATDTPAGQALPGPAAA
jgi:hypothetical protein